MNKETILLNRIFNYMDDTPGETLEYFKREGINPQELIEKTLEFLDRLKKVRTSKAKENSGQDMQKNT
jgi:hypothetical protein